MCVRECVRESARECVRDNVPEIVRECVRECVRDIVRESQGRRVHRVRGWGDVPAFRVQGLGTRV